MSNVASRTPESVGAPQSSPGFTLQEDIWFGDFDDDEARKTAAASLSAMGGRIMGARPIPAAAQKLVQLTRDEDADVHKVVRVLEMDPGLSQKILRLVNSAGYGLRIRCTSLQHATALLGQVKLRQVATSAVLFDHFGKASPLTRKKQEHGALVASLCRYLAIHLGLPQDDLFTIGLLHDIGELMMLDDDLKGYAELLEGSDGEFDGLHLRERELLGFDHAVLAAHVLASWSIPSPLPEVIALHHQPALAHQHSLDVAAMVQTLRFADQMSHLLEHKAPKRSIATLAESEAASYLDFSEVQIAAMWRDLERVQEVTKNRRLNIMDMAPRTVSVPDSLRPRDVPFSRRPQADELTSRPPAAESVRNPAHQIAVPSYGSPLALLGQPSVRRPDPSSHTSPSPLSTNGARDHKPFLAFAATDPSELAAEQSQKGPVFSPLSSHRIEVPTRRVDEAPPTPQSVVAAPRLEPGIPSERDEEPTPRPAVRPLFDGAHTDEAMLAKLTGAVPVHLEPKPPAETHLPAHPFHAPAFGAEAEADPPGAAEPWFEQASGDVNPEVFPCSFCYAPTFGASCSVCNAQTCPEHQVTSRQWCVACEDEFQSYLREHGTSPLVPLSVGVSLGIAVLATWYFASLDGALGILSIGAVLVFGLFVLHHVRLKRSFRIARRRTLDEESDDAPAPALTRNADPEDPMSRVLEAIGEDDESKERDAEAEAEPSPFSMPVPAPRAHALIVAPICEPPRPSLMNFKRESEHVPVFESLLAPRPTPEPSPAAVRILPAQAAPSREPESSPSEPMHQKVPGEVIRTWPAPSHEDDPSPQSSAAPHSSASAAGPGPQAIPESPLSHSNSPVSVEPLERSLRSIAPAADENETEAPLEELTVVGYSADVCELGSPSSVIVVPELHTVKSYCVGIPQNTVSIESARSA